MNHLIEFEAHEESLVHGGHEMDNSKSNSGNEVCIYYKKKKHIKSDCYKLQNRENLATIKNGKQPKTSGKADIVENDHSKEEILIISDDDSKLDEY